MINYNNLLRFTERWKLEQPIDFGVQMTEQEIIDSMPVSLQGCSASCEGYECTKQRAHTGPHIAVGINRICAIWD